MRNKRKKAGITALCVLFWILLWQVAASVANRSLLLPIPTPLSVAAALGRLFAARSFYAEVALSLFRIAAGYCAAVLCGTVGAVVAHRVPFFRALTAPLLSVVRAVPVAAFILLVFLWMDTAWIPIFIAFLMVFPLVWSNVFAGLDTVSVELTEMAHVMGMKRAGVLRYIVFPAVRPSLTAALSSGLGFAWKSGVAAEVICRTARSIGNHLWVSKNAIDYDEVFALTAVIVVLSVLLETLVHLAVRRQKK